MVTTGVIGLGAIGSRLARNLLDSEFETVVFDIREEAVAELVERGAVEATDAGAVARQSDVVLLSLPAPDHVIAVFEEIETHLQPGDTLVDATTSTPETTNEIAARLAERDVHVLGAPISGTKSAVESGDVTVMVGGDSSVLDESRPVLESFAASIRHVGPEPGHGHAMKLINNFVAFSTFVATSEAVVLGQQAGMDLETMIDTLNESSGRSFASEFIFPEQIMNDRFDMEFPLALASKDIKLYNHFGNATGTPIFVASLVQQLIDAARVGRGGETDYTRTYDFIAEQMTGDPDPATK